MIKASKGSTRDRRRALLLQIAFVGALIFLAGSVILETQRTLERTGITGGFAFLQVSTGWDILFSLVPYSTAAPYWWAFVVGLINTVFIGLICIALSTILGTGIGLLRLTPYPVVQSITRLYVEIFRGVPLILQAIFWYAVATHLPRPKQAINFGDAVLLSGRGIYIPSVQFDLISGVVLVAGLVVLVMAIYCLFVRAHTRAIRLVLVAIAAALFLTWYDRTITPIGTIDLPALKGFNIRGGWRITPEFGALALALTLYGGAYIAEIVRNGLITVPRSQMDAARALALSPWATFWTVRLPLALRTIVPPLGNQYVFLMKATTVGVVIGFNDLFMVTTTAIVQLGQTIEVFALMILCFLCINYTIITIMGTINKALKIEGYEDDQ